MRALSATQFILEYPRSVGVYDDYLQAQRVVDYLSDQQFPVQNIALVGTDLKSVERVTGRLTRAKAATPGALVRAVDRAVRGHRVLAVQQPRPARLPSHHPPARCGVHAGVEPDRLHRRHPRRPPRLHLRQPDRRDQVRDARRTPRRRAGPRNAYRYAGDPVMTATVRVNHADAVIDALRTMLPSPVPALVFTSLAASCVPTCRRSATTVSPGSPTGPPGPGRFWMTTSSPGCWRAHRERPPAASPRTRDVSMRDGCQRWLGVAR